MKRLMLAALLVALVAAPAQAQVRVDIGIHLPGPPTLVLIPDAPVYYVPTAAANVFFYGHQYWVFANNGWYVGPNWNGPWVIVQPVHVPPPILRVPVRYYRVHPAHWTGWRHDHPPRWEPQWGREWREEAHERDWREREERWGHGKHKGQGQGQGQGKGKGKGHGK